MKLLHAGDLHDRVAFISIGAFFAALGVAANKQELNFEVVFLCVICILLRFKFWIDDREYFGNVEKTIHSSGRGFRLGLVVAILSWFPWFLAGATVGNPPLCAAFMFFMFLLSTAWIMTTWVDQRPYPAQVGWMFYNTTYAGCFFILWKRNAPWFPLPDHKDAVILVVETLVLLILSLDVSTSGTLTALAKLGEK